jgi:hypothetical protein
MFLGPVLERDARDHGVEIDREVEPAPLEISGRAYAPPLPAVAGVAATTRFLITLTVPADPRQLAYPQTLRYHRGGRRYATAPDIAVASWQEHLLVVAAHEWRHVHQFRVGGVRSEVKADQWALARLLAWRAGRS